MAFAMLAGLIVSSSRGSVIAYYNFNTLNVTPATGSVAPGTNNVPLTLAPTSGAGTISLAGWTGGIEDFNGSLINTLNNDPAGVALCLTGGLSTGSTAGNNGYIDLSFPMLGQRAPFVSFATRGTAAGFTTGTWSYSVDGVHFAAASVPNTVTNATTFGYASASFYGINALDDQPSVTLRYTLTGATGNLGNIRLDNLQVYAYAINHPPTVATGVSATATFGDDLSVPATFSAMVNASDADPGDEYLYLYLTDVPDGVYIDYVSYGNTDLGMGFTIAGQVDPSLYGTGPLTIGFLVYDNHGDATPGSFQINVVPEPAGLGVIVGAAATLRRRRAAATFTAAAR